MVMVKKLLSNANNGNDLNDFLEMVIVQMIMSRWPPNDDKVSTAIDQYDLIWPTDNNFSVILVNVTF